MNMHLLARSLSFVSFGHLVPTPFRFYYHREERRPDAMFMSALLERESLLVVSRVVFVARLEIHKCASVKRQRLARTPRHIAYIRSANSARPHNRLPMRFGGESDSYDESRKRQKPSNARESWFSKASEKRRAEMCVFLPAIDFSYALSSTAVRLCASSGFAIFISLLTSCESAQRSKRTVLSGDLLAPPVASETSRHTHVAPGLCVNISLFALRKPFWYPRPSPAARFA